VASPPRPRRTGPPRPKPGARVAPGRPRRSGPPLPKNVVERVAPVRVAILSIGRELLRGRAADANAPWIASWMSRRGALVHRILVVDDAERAISSAISEALAWGCHLVVTTGGLGPAPDDRTLAALSEALRRPLSLSPMARTLVDEAYTRLRKRGVVAHGGMTAAREKMATVPVGSDLVPNPVGIAPGILVRLPGGGGVLALPGEPEEMRAVFEEAVPILRELAPRGAVAEREVEAPTADEAALRPLLEKLAAEFPALWITGAAPRPGTKDGRITITLEASAATKNEAESVVEGALRRLIALSAGG